MTATARSTMIAGAEVLIDGRSLDPRLSGNIVELRVEQHLLLPDVATVRIADPGLEHVDGGPLEVGAELRVRLSAPDSHDLVPLFVGRIAALEPEFSASGAVLGARAYDASEALNRVQRSATFQNMTADDIARKLVTAANVPLGTVDAAGPPQPFVQQHAETDLRFLWRLAAAVDFEVVVEDGKLHFRRAGGRAGDPPITARWGEGLHTFRPRISGAAQVADVTVRGWDASAGRAVEANVPLADPDSQIGQQREPVSSASGGGAIELAGQAVVDHDEAERLAGSVAARLSNALVDAVGMCRGEPRMQAGGRVTIEGVGTRFGGTYAVTEVTHVFRGRRGYHTQFTVSGRSVRGLAQLLAPAPGPEWGASLVVGIVTQNDDPDGLGRVRVKYPSLGDSVEGWWARIASFGSGPHRGALMLPLVGDEVVVGFEQGDPRRPYVLGTLWNGQARPGAELAQSDGSFGLRSDERVAVTAKSDVSIRGGRDLSIETDGKVVQHAGGDIEVEGQRVTVKAKDTLTVESRGDMTLRAPSMAVEATRALRLSGTSVSIG